MFSVPWPHVHNNMRYFQICPICCFYVSHWCECIAGHKCQRERKVKDTFRTDSMRQWVIKLRREHAAKQLKTKMFLVPFCHVSSCHGLSATCDDTVVIVA